MIDLWPHQKAAIAAGKGAIERHFPAGLIAMPTGCGKSVAGARLAADLDRPTLVMVHRDELIRQWRETFAQVWPDASVGVVKADRDEWLGHDVVVASVQSLHARRLAQMPEDRFGLIIADEAHHAVAPSWRAVLDHFDTDFVFGMTATPERADGKGLAELFGEQALYSYGVRQAIENEHLCPLRQFAIETETDLGDVSYRMGDFAEGELSQAVNTANRNSIIIEAFQEHAADRRAVAFCVGVDHAHGLADTFADAGITSATVTGTTPTDERRQLLKDFAAGNIRVMTNCMVLTEGFDDPGIDAILMARPTASRPLYTQAVGRGLRLAPGKDDLLVLDFVDNCRKHKLVTAMSLLGAPKKDDANGQDVLDAVDADVAEAEQLQLIETRRPVSWCATRVCPWPEMPTLAGYVATRQWHCDQASEKQVRYLRALGLQIERAITKGEACHLIDRTLEYKAAFPDPPTDKQKWFLKHQGAWRDDMTFDEARRLIGELKAGQAVGAVA